MIAAGIVQQIRQLLAETKLSYRKIAAIAGVSRNTVGAIANRLRDYDKAKAFDDDPAVPSSPPGRCLYCGGLVYLPCRLCQIRETIAEASPPPRQLDDDEEPLLLQLKEEHRRRYEDLRLRQAAAGII
jgi:hypothetical protein